MRIEHDPRRGLFETVVEGVRAHLEYGREDGRLAILHTVVPEAVGGRGIAGALTEAALDYARAEGLKVEPRCAYAQAWFRRHPEAADLLA
ncbi:GNAT family N-acetyltransferase [Luteimonas huabeiensis]|uniref:GNAT family N-acetyltransferase n=1 Tax=Luteimonas huabeiensis TaxID=1244513 RepID=UPI000466D98D|nr:GNAT family N-acetyltransferase [Luteimonas huabeiensis]